MAGIAIIDLKKAFDTVDHSILCRKLESCGVRNKELFWFKFYLSDRRHYCRINGADSQINAVDIGVPQNSCLSPLTFYLHKPKAMKNCSVAMYADDTSFKFRSTTLAQLNETINKD